ncbi:hypothetical protein ABZY90_27855 [Streptomyces sp. NPDC006422]|uniref:hypothetical protein n=1 Tax=unclassified Streptomyces TaxID=2593676 RepID=UPI0033B209DE
MPDRSLRLTLPTGAVLPREGRPTPPSPPAKESDGPKDDNPFAPPPEDAPDRPWQPRHPEGSDSDSGSGRGGGSPWGSQWSDRQPGPAQGGRFGDRPGGGPENQGGGQGQGPGPGGMRWDPTDPAQRRARYALLSGMWGFFFALFSWPYVALLLGVLALYWGVSALRMKPRPANPDAPAPATPRPAGPETARPQTTAAVSGLVTGALALAMVASLFTAKMVYSDYYECRADALTNAAKKSCEDLLPKELRPLLGER